MTAAWERIAVSCPDSGIGTKEVGPLRANQVMAVFSSVLAYALLPKRAP
jgi:hypothetical protein